MVIRKIKREKERINYKVFALRLNEETKMELIKRQKESGLSWNLFILELLKNGTKY